MAKIIKYVVLLSSCFLVSTVSAQNSLDFRSKKFVIAKADLVKPVSRRLWSLNHPKAVKTNVEGWAVSGHGLQNGTVAMRRDAGKKGFIELTANNPSAIFSYTPKAGELHVSIKRLLRFNYSFNENLFIYVYVATTEGQRILSYSHSDRNLGRRGRSNIIHHKLGAVYEPGEWQTFRRDIQKDLQRYDPRALLTSITSVRFKGSGKIAKLSLESGLSGSYSFEYDADDEISGNFLDAGAVVSDTFGLVFSQASQKYLFAKNKIDIDLSRKYILSGLFRSVGLEQSKVHVGLIMYNSSGHYLGLRYLIIDEMVSKHWQELKGVVLQGESRVNSWSKFATGTKSVRLFVLANYQQSQDSELRFDSLRFESEDSSI